MQLSGGQQQRVALARALVNRPRALLLDEPLGALDLRLRKQLQIELKRIQQDVGITFVHVTHDQEEAMTMADTIAVMNDGRIEQAGGAEDLYERPRTAFVANFLGISNLIDGALGATRRRPDDRRDARRRDAARARPSASARTTPTPSASACGRRRSRSSRPAPRRARGANVLRGTVVVASFLGVSIQYLVRTAGGEELTVFAQNADGSEPDALAVGREVQLAWNPEHTFVVAKEPAMSSDPSFEHHLEQLLDARALSRRRLRPRRRRACSATGLAAFARRLRRGRGHEAARPARRRRPPTRQPPEDGDRQLDVLQLAALHRQEGPEDLRQAATAATSSTSRTSTTTSSSSARSASSCRPSSRSGATS